MVVTRSNGYIASGKYFLLGDYPMPDRDCTRQGSFRLAVTHNDNRLDKAGGKLLSSPCAQRA